MIPLQNNTQALKIMFQASQNSKAKHVRKKPKNKSKLQQCISLYTLPQTLPLQNSTQALKIVFPAT